MVGGYGYGGSYGSGYGGGYGGGAYREEESHFVRQAEVCYRCGTVTLSPGSSLCREIKDH